MLRLSTLFRLFILLFCLPQLAWVAEPVSLPDLLLRARDYNPDILAARQSWKMAQSEVAPARAWPDPTFTYVNERFPSGMAGVDPENVQHYRIEQMVPFPGKLTNEARMKNHESLIRAAEYKAVTLEVFRNVQARYYQLFLTDKLIALAEQSVEVLKQTLKSAQGRLAGGQSSTSDVFMVQTELRRMENMLFEQKQQRTLIQIELNTLLDRAPDSPLGAAAPPELKDVPASLSDLDKLAFMNNPHYMMAMHEISHSRAMVSRNRLQFAPDFGFMYERETAGAGPAGRQIGVSVSFPLWLSRPWGAYQSAKAHVTEAEASSEGMRNTVRKMVHTEYAEVGTYLAQSRNYSDGILPAAQSNLKIARQQYASGQADFLRFLEAFRTWITTQNEYQDKLYQYGDHWSELERWVGVPLDKTKEALAHSRTEREINHAH